MRRAGGSDGAVTTDPGPVPAADLSPVPALAVVDVEGNGQQPPEIVEIAVLPLAPDLDPTLADLRTWLIRPARPITGLVTRKVHGISNDDVAHAPRWTEIATEIAAALAGRIVVAHNAAVERRVLRNHLPGWDPPMVLDTLRLAKAVWPDLPGGYGLDNLIAHRGLDTAATDKNTVDTEPKIGPIATQMRRHRAGYDTWMTAALLIALIGDSGLNWDHLAAAARLPEPSTSRSWEPMEEGLW